MAFVPLLVGGLIGWAASKIGGSDQPAQQAATSQPGAPKATDLPPPPTPAPQAQSEATAAATTAGAKQRRRSAAGNSGRVLPLGQSGTRRSPAPQASAVTKPVTLLGGTQ
jgi:hypothetical protein